MLLVVAGLRRKMACCFIFGAFFAYCLLGLSSSSAAFCGFYVAKADSNLFNEASKVIIARAQGRTVLTMANDYQGDPQEFAIVIPVPEVLTEQQINVADNNLVEHVDAYSAPRLVEYFDANPCQQIYMDGMARSMAMNSVQEKAADSRQSPAALGVTIEAEYTVGEYDIVILSAEQSGGLERYLDQEGYKLPHGASRILGSYIRQDMKFFLAKVNLREHQRSGYSYLRPLQIAFESNKFMLPIRLGTLNAKNPQDLLLYTLTKKGRVEAGNYRTVKIPSDQNIPTYVKNDGEFGAFYKAMFTQASERENRRAVFLEYAWDMGWCDPCAADPISNEDLKMLGVWWIDQPRPVPMQGWNNRIMAPQPSPGADVFITRLHVRYDAESFPEDLMLVETSDRENFQGRYVLQHPWDGEMNCAAARDYMRSLPERFEQEAVNLANLTGWDINEIREKMSRNGQDPDGGRYPSPGPYPSRPPENGEKPWWENMWNK